MAPQHVRLNSDQLRNIPPDSNHQWSLFVPNVNAGSMSLSEDFP